MQHLLEKVAKAFAQRFDTKPIFINSPGRVNLIGGHTDYNNGFVLPATIDKNIVLGIAPNDRQEIRLYAIDPDEEYQTDSSNMSKSDTEWPNYILGVVDQLIKNDYSVQGFDCVFGGSVPIGAGLSSSAALEGGVIFGLSTLFDLKLSKLDMAVMAQKAENQYVGVQCGIMDQFVNIHGKDRHVLKLDCRSLEYELYPFDHEEIHIVIFDTKLRHELASSEYNVRRQECEKGVEILSQYDDSVKSLRDVSPELLEAHKSDMDHIIYNRCKYIVEENIRVEEACRDLERDDIDAFGKRMTAAHEAIRDLYEVSCEELDILVEEAKKLEGVIGSRMMGGGFGGCTVNLIRDAHLDEITHRIQEEYRRRTGKDVEIYLTNIDGGVSEISADEQELVSKSK